MLNKVMLIGRLGKDPELRYSQGGTPVANFTIATDESYTDRDGNRQERTEWHRIVVFQRAAENCNTYLSKGSLVYIEGSLQTRKWQDQNGQDRYTTEIKAQRVQFLDRKGDRPPAEEGDGAYANRPQQAPQRGSWEQNQRRQSQQYAKNARHDDDDMGSPFPSEAGGGMPFPQDDDMGSPFPSGASGQGKERPAMDEVPF